MILAQRLKIATFIKIGFGRLSGRKATVKQIILTLTVQLTQCRENFNSDFASFLLCCRAEMSEKCILVSLGKKGNQNYLHSLIDGSL